MEESYVEDLASHDGPAHALAFRDGAAKRWCRGARRPAIAASKWARLGCRRAVDQRKATPVAGFSRAVSGPRGGGEPVHARDLFHAENREVSRSPACRDGGAGRTGNAVDGNPVMHDRDKLDGLVVPVKLANNAKAGRRSRWREADRPRGT